MRVPEKIEAIQTIISSNVGKGAVPIATGHSTKIMANTINSLIDVVHEQEILIIDIRKDIWAQQVEIENLKKAMPNRFTIGKDEQGETVFISHPYDDKEETK